MNSKKTIGWGLGFGVAMLASVLIPLVGMLSSFLAIACAVLGGGIALALCAGVALIGGVLLAGAACIPALVPALIAGAIAYFAIKHVRGFDGLIVCCGGALLAIWVYFYTFNLITGQDLLKMVYEQGPQLYLDSLREFSVASGVDFTQYAGSVGQLQDAIGLTMPATALVFAMFWGLLLMVFGCAIGKKAKATVFVLPAFVYWRLANSFMWALLLLMLTAYVGVAASWHGFDSIMIATQALFSVALGMQGISTLAFYYRAYNNAVIIIIGIVAGITMAFLPFTLLGVIDSGFGLRARYLIEHGGLPVKSNKIKYHDHQKNK